MYLGFPFEYWRVYILSVQFGRRLQSVFRILIGPECPTLNSQSRIPQGSVHPTPKASDYRSGFRVCHLLWGELLTYSQLPFSCLFVQLTLHSWDKIPVIPFPVPIAYSCLRKKGIMKSVPKILKKKPDSPRNEDQMAIGPYQKLEQSSRYPQYKQRDA